VRAEAKLQAAAPPTEVAAARGAPRLPAGPAVWTALLRAAVPPKPGLMALLPATTPWAVAVATVAAVVTACLRLAAMELGPALAAAATTTAVVRLQLALRRLLLRCAPAGASVAAHRGQMMILGLTLSLHFLVHLRWQRLLQLR
jgi:hypothetical protein